MQPGHPSCCSSSPVSFPYRARLCAAPRATPAKAPAPTATATPAKKTLVHACRAWGGQASGQGGGQGLHLCPTRLLDRARRIVRRRGDAVRALTPLSPPACSCRLPPAPAPLRTTSAWISSEDLTKSSFPWPVHWGCTKRSFPWLYIGFVGLAKTAGQPARACPRNGARACPRNGHLP